MIVGLTGGIATGKSTVTQMLRDLGAKVIDADVWARKIVEPGQPALAEIVEVFGASVLEPDGRLNRAALAAIVFRDSQLRERLNAITHPRVRAGMRAETETWLRSNPSDPVVWDVPLLFEGETRQLVDVTLVVYTDDATQRARLMRRDGLLPAEADARIQAQWPIEEKRRLADYVIDNAGTVEQTREQVQLVWTVLRQRAEAGGASS